MKPKKIKNITLVILAGGLGSRLSEETVLKPKPLIEIGRLPIIVHIMKYYSTFGVNNFIICLGYKGHLIREYFINRFLSSKNLSLDLENNPYLKLKAKVNEKWKIQFIDTGKKSLTGKRIKLIENHLDENENEFFLTYGDGLSDIRIDKTLHQFRVQKKIGLISGVKINPKFGIIDFNSKNIVRNFSEKKSSKDTWINAGFGIFSRKIFKYIGKKENISFEERPLSKLAEDGELTVFKHTGKWKCMDTLRDKIEFEDIFKKKPFWIRK
jgi:glucose-1-phosphate cytidylyltransferase